MKMQKNRTKKGFTLAEILIAIAIISILGGVAAINVARYFRSLTKLEYDNYAKSIFVAAQNHLIMAEHEGYLGRTDFGTNEDKIEGISDTGNGVYYFVVKDGDIKANSVLNLILPENAIDATVRSQSYIIRYQKATVQVLDVFYWSEVGHGGSLFNRASRFAHQYQESDYADFLRNRSDKDALTDYGQDHSVIGYYGGVEARGKTPVKIKDPSIVVHNEEVLYVRITDPNADIKTSLLYLVIKGNTSGAFMSITVDTKNTNPRIKQISNDPKEPVFDVILDDITTPGLHFSDLGSGFYPGEDITVYAMSSNSEPSNVGYSAEAITNSLFEDSTKVKSGTNVQPSVDAGITNFRHLENMSPTVSGIADSATNAAKPVYLESAKQQADMVWDVFRGNVNTLWRTWKESRDHVKIYYTGGSTADDQYFPVDPIVKLSYDGQNHRIRNVSTNHSGNAGLFGELTNGSSVSNLELVDFNIINSSTNTTNPTSAGALAGSMTNCAVTNVLAHDSGRSLDAVAVSASSGHAGGLIGSMNGGSVTRSAAALVVSGSENAGGLIGSMTGGKVEKSYAGGHTENAQYSATKYNVTGSTAGGLIGSMSGGEVRYSYSTCSASGTTAGGFVGSGSGDISNSYCTGLVAGSTKGAFAGTLGDTVSNCWYFEIINEVQDANQGYTCLPATGGGASRPGIKPFDETAKTYNDFCGSPNTPNTWNAANPYDTTLNRYYSGSFNLRTVDQIGQTTKAKSTSSDFVSAHYGDWPAPEAFVVNKGGSSGNPTTIP